MPRPGPRRPQVCARVDATTLERLDALAECRGVVRSEAVRLSVVAGLDAIAPVDVPDDAGRLGYGPHVETETGYDR